jgi:hypothetical protein
VANSPLARLRASSSAIERWEGSVDVGRYFAENSSGDAPGPGAATENWLAQVFAAAPENLHRVLMTQSVADALATFPNLSRGRIWNDAYCPAVAWTRPLPKSKDNAAQGWAGNTFMTGEVCVTLLKDANVRELASRREGAETLKWNTLMSTLEDASSLKVTILPSRDGFQRAEHVLTTQSSFMTSSPAMNNLVVTLP